MRITNWRKGHRQTKYRNTRLGTIGISYDDPNGKTLCLSFYDADQDPSGDEAIARIDIKMTPNEAQKFIEKLSKALE